MIELILVHHAETVANVEGRWVGWGDTGLTGLGLAQADATARRLAVEAREASALYTSPLPRALRTAEAIGRALDLEPILVDGLREINFGELDGIRIEEMKVRYPMLYDQWKDKTDFDYTWPGGERRADFFRRVAAACDDIISRHAQGTVIVIGHGGTQRAILAHLLPEGLGHWWSYSLGNCGLTRVALEERGARLIALNDTAHLSSEHSPSFA